MPKHRAAGRVASPSTKIDGSGAATSTEPVPAATRPDQTARFAAHSSPAAPERSGTQDYSVVTQHPVSPTDRQSRRFRGQRSGCIAAPISRHRPTADVPDSIRVRVGVVLNPSRRGSVESFGARSQYAERRARRARRHQRCSSPERSVSVPSSTSIWPSSPLDCSRVSSGSLARHRVLESPHDGSRHEAPMSRSARARLERHHVT